MPEPLPTSEPPSREKWLRISFYLLIFAVGMLVCFHPMLFGGFARMQSDAGDTVLNHYFVEHTWLWVSDTTYPASFWSPQFFYPTRYALTYSENLIGAAPLYWGLRLFWSEPTAWIGWILIVNACNYWAMLIVLRWFGINPILAVLGGFLFAFGLPRQDQFSHQHLMPHLFAPFVVWHFWKFVEAPRRWHWFWVLFLSAWQMLASIHLGWFLVFALCIVLAVHFLYNRSAMSRIWSFIKERRAFVAWTMAAWSIGLGLFFRNYFIGNESTRRYYGECVTYMPSLFSWLACPPESLWKLHLVPGEDNEYAERHLFTGFGFYLLLIAAIIAVRKRRTAVELPAQAGMVRSCLATCLILVLLTLNLIQGASLWFAVFNVVPGANSIRAIGRVWFSFVLLSLIAGSIAFQFLVQSRIRSPWLQLTIYGVLLAVCVGEQVHPTIQSFATADYYPRAANLSKYMTDADAAYACYDWETDIPFYEQYTTTMWAGFWARMPVVNGFSGRIPNNFVVAREEWPVEEVVRFLGPEWRGRLLMIQPGEPTRRRWYQVEPGDDPASRFTLVRADP